MRLVTGAEMKAIDQHAIKTIGIPSLVLMENAGIKILFTLEKILKGLRGKHFTIICGKGNNGGDGVVVARHLINNRIPVNLFICARPNGLSPDMAANVKILQESGYEPIFMSGKEDLDKLQVALEFSDCALDAIFGTGFSGEIEGYSREVIRIINTSRPLRVAIDIPSGVCASTGMVSTTSFQANVTITLGLPKLGLFLYPGRECTGEVWIADIGLPQLSQESIRSTHTLLTREVASSILPSRLENSHKGSFGHVMLLAGSRSYPGAGVLASYGALRSGAGLVTLGLPEGLIKEKLMQVLPDLILRTFADVDGSFSLTPKSVQNLNGSYASIVAGPGWGRTPSAKESVKNLVANWQGGLLLDADALNGLGKMPKELRNREQLILTPHIGEMARLAGKTATDIQKDLIGSARSFVRQIPCVLVLKCSTPVVASPDGEIFLCSRPNSALARGGSGDLLAGLIGGILATGVSPLVAALAGVWLHAEAAELGSQELGADGITISEVASYLPRAFLRLRGEEKE